MLRQVAPALPVLATLVHPCTSTRKKRSDMLAQKAHDNGPPKWLAEVDKRSKPKTVKHSMYVFQDKILLVLLGFVFSCF